MHYLRIVNALCCVIITVKVKWGKEKFEGVELNTDEPPEVFKMQLFSLSGEHIHDSWPL